MQGFSQRGLHAIEKCIYPVRKHLYSLTWH
jgi:hypothetical protein